MRQIYLFAALFFTCGQMIFGHVLAQVKEQHHPQISLLFNKDHLLPFKRLDEGKMVIVSDAPQQIKPFVEQVNRYVATDVVPYSIFDKGLPKADTILFVDNGARIDGVKMLKIKKAIAAGKKVVLCKLSNPNSKIPFTHNVTFGGDISEIVVAGIGDNPQRELAMSLFGGLPIASSTISLATAKTRLQYNGAQYSKLNIAKMTQKIDAIADEAMREQAAPGMVVMAIKDGNVIFEKAYGYHTYEKKVPTKVTDIFDVASVSKIAGTTPVIMDLYDKGVLQLDSTMGFYLPDVRNTDKSAIKLRSVLLHEAGFTPFIPFYRTLKPGDLQRVYSDSHQVKVADNAFLKNNYYKDVMWPEMMASPLKTTGQYVYSDISMYVMKEVAEHITNRPMDSYVMDTFYKPMGMWTAGYNPRTRFDKNRIVPTENDTSFRKVLLEGYVHDQGAAMANGVAGHAGLFTSANDLAIYGQMLLNKGEYGGISFLKPGTIDLFTSNQSNVSRRGFGFDRFDPKPGSDYPSKLANNSVYGHTGYTGTCVWVDPKNQLIYIFLSNRVHPQVSTKLLNLNIRSRIQDAIYETIQEGQ